MIVTPLFDRILVKPVEEDQLTRGGLAIPDVAMSSKVFGYGEVVGIGGGRRDATGGLIKPVLKVGDLVMFPKKNGLEVPIPMSNGEDVVFLLFREPDIFAKVSDLPKPSLVLDADGKRLLAMTPNSHAKPDVAYKNTEDTEIARREGWLDSNPDGSDDHTDEVH